MTSSLAARSDFPTEGTTLLVLPAKLGARNATMPLSSGLPDCQSTPAQRSRSRTLQSLYALSGLHPPWDLYFFLEEIRLWRIIRKLS